MKHDNHDFYDEDLEEVEGKLDAHIRNSLKIKNINHKKPKKMKKTDWNK